MNEASPVTLVLPTQVNTRATLWRTPSASFGVDERADPAVEAAADRVAARSSGGTGGAGRAARLAGRTLETALLRMSWPAA
jgi:hypothetical protein